MPKKNNSQEYWAKRRQQDKIKVINTGENGINNLKKLLKNNLDDVEKQITKYFEKYADKKENLSPKELLAYKKKLKDAVKKVPNDKILKKLLIEDAPKYKIERLRALQTDLQLTLTEATIAQEKGIANTLDDVAKVSQSVLAKSMKDAIGLSFNTIASKKLKQILSSDWSGATWSDRLWKDRELVGKKLTDILERGMVQGTSLQTMSRELKQVTGQSFNNAFRLIRTETSHIDGQVTLEGYKQAGEELGLEYYEYDAFLDSRTSTICRELDKKRFKVSEAKVGVNYPPMHPNCRSTTQLVLDEDYKQEESRSENPNNSREEQKIQKPIGNENVDFSNVVEIVRWKNTGEDFKGNIIASTIDEAQKIAEQNGVIVANFEKMSLEQANEINKALVLLPRNTRPDYIADAKTLIDKNLLSKSRGLKSFYGVSLQYPTAVKNQYGKYVEIDHIVGYNTTIYKTFKAIEKTKQEFNKQIAESYAKGQQKFRGTSWTGERWYFNTQGNATIYHELAHSYANKKGIPQGFEELGKRWAKESNIGQIQTINEAWAEAFAGYHIQNTELPDYIRNYMKGLVL